MPLSQRAMQTLAYLNSYLDQPPTWFVRWAEVEELNRHLRHLADEVPGIAEATILDRDRARDSRDGAEQVTSDRFVRALRHARSLILLSERTTATPATGPEVVERRFQVLADLVQAYLVEPGQSIIELPAGDDEVVLTHPGFPGGRLVANPIMADLHALSTDDLIIWRRAPRSMGGEIHIPTWVLEAPDVRAAKTGREIKQVVNSQQAYHNSNVAYDSTDVKQTVNIGVQPGDIEAFIDALRGLGVQEPELTEFREAASADDGYERAQTVAHKVFQGAAGNVLGSVAYETATRYQGMLELIQRFWGYL